MTRENKGGFIFARTMKILCMLSLSAVCAIPIKLRRVAAGLGLASGSSAFLASLPRNSRLPLSKAMGTTSSTLQMVSPLDDGMPMENSYSFFDRKVALELEKVSKKGTITMTEQLSKYRV